MRYRVLLVAVLVVLAGCSGIFGGSDEPTATITPAAVPTDQPTPTPVPQFAPGLTGKGIENASALLEAHASFLQDRSFTTTTNTTAVAPNGSVVFQRTSTLHAGPAGEGVYVVYERNGSDSYPGPATGPVRVELWLNHGRVFRHRRYQNGTTTTNRQRMDANERLVAARAGLEYTLEPFGTANTSVTKRERNGTTRYLVRGRIHDDGGFSQGNESLRLVVDSHGVIHTVRTVRRLSDKNVSHVVSETRFSGIGTTDPPERPSWVDTAMNRTTPVPAPAAPTAYVATVTAENPTGTTNRTATANAPTATGSP